MKTPEQIATEVVGKLVSDNGAVRRINQSIIYRWVERAIEADRAQRSDMEQFGEFVYGLLDATEWDSDTLQAVGDYAAFTLNRPFSEPGEEAGL